MSSFLYRTFSWRDAFSFASAETKKEGTKAKVYKQDKRWIAEVTFS